MLRPCWMLRAAAWLLALLLPAAAMRGGDEGGTVSQLQALAQLHAAGSLTDAEFSQAKRRVLEVPPAPPPLEQLELPCDRPPWAPRYRLKSAGCAPCGSSRVL